MIESVSPDMFGDFEFGITFHPYQEQAIARVLDGYRQREKRFHVVAPPGSGKTIIGLEVIRSIGRKAVILSPNTTIQAQWADKFRSLMVDTSIAPGLGQVQEVISCHRDSLAPILSLTYQEFSVKRRPALGGGEGVEQPLEQDLGEAGDLRETEEDGNQAADWQEAPQNLGEGDDGEWLHKNVVALFSTLKDNGYRTILLDECHHLMAHWARVVARFADEVPDAVVIGLTATPPVDRKERELEAYLDLVGEVDYEIPTPAVIRQGHLAPFQDLVYLVRPTEEEGRFLDAAHSQLHRVMALLSVPEKSPGQTGESSLPARMPLVRWAEEWLRSPTDSRGRPFGPDRLLERRPDLAIAAVRYLRSEGLQPPAVCPWTEEMDGDPNMGDLALLLGEYGLSVLAPSAEGAERQSQSQGQNEGQSHSQGQNEGQSQSQCSEPDTGDLWSQVRAALEALGFIWRAGGFSKRAGPVDHVLALSSSKLRAVEAILNGEAAIMGDGLRALVLTDFETAHVPGGRASLEGVLDPQAGGAVGVMRLLTSNPTLDLLDPLMVTGKTLLCDDDLLPRFMEESRRFLDARGLKADLEAEPVEGFYRIVGRGPDWRSRTYVLLVTELLDRGVTRCLVGTRALLGEGWDCLSLNTLVDLTAAATYVAVNQVRGRTLRRDPDADLKIANNWDVVTVMPELEGGYGDLDRFFRKHEHFFGVSDDGLIEKGVGHVHPLFDQVDRDELLRRMDEINGEMLTRAADRADAFRAWKVGQPYRCQEVACVQLCRLSKALVPNAGSSIQGEAKNVPEKEPVPQGVQSLDLDRSPVMDVARQEAAWATLKPARRRARLVWAASGLSGVVALGSVLALGFPLLVGVALAAGAAAVGLGTGLLGSRGLFKRVGQEALQRLNRSEQGELLLGMARALVTALIRAELIKGENLSPRPDSSDDHFSGAVQVTKRSGGVLRVHLETESVSDAEVFAEALDEMLGPIRDQRYLIEVLGTPRYLMPGRLTRIHRFHVRPPQVMGHLPVPRLLGRSRSMADLLLDAFMGEVGPARILYTRRGEGQTLLASLFNHRSLEARPHRLKLWR